MANQYDPKVHFYVLLEEVERFRKLERKAMDEGHRDLAVEYNRKALVFWNRAYEIDREMNGYPAEI